MKLTIASTWNGEPLDLSEQATVWAEKKTEGLWVQVESPHYNDPLPTEPVGACDGLWDYEVVELFVAHGETYSELELGPSGHHLLLQLNGIRNIVAKMLPIVPAWSYESGRWFCEVLIPWPWLPPEPWTLNAYAIHGVGQKRRYLAASPVPGLEPDFHRLSYFKAWLTDPADREC